MATTYKHIEMNVVDALGNLTVLYPANKSTDVAVVNTNPNLESAKTLDEVLGKIGTLAFKSDLSGLIAEATSSNAGLMPAADKAKLDKVTGDEMGYLAGVTSSIQTQLNGKAGNDHVHGNITNDGKIGSEGGKVITTGADGTLQATVQNTAFNKNFTNAEPVVAGVASAGVSTDVARADHVHPAQTTVSGNAGTATKLETGRQINGTLFDGTADITTEKWGTARNINVTGAVTATAAGVDGSGDITITATEVQASAITGVLDLANIPAAALERCVVVADDEARFALTDDDVQKGDTVKVTETGMMYMVVDDTKLNIEDGYVVFSSGTASSVPWSGVTGKPSQFPPEAHTHGALSNDGKIGGAEGKVITTGAEGVLQATDAGTAFNKNFSDAAAQAPAGTGAAGSSTDVARADHVHPLQTSVSGNAGTATKLAAPVQINGTDFDGSAPITTAKWGTARKITLTGDATGEVTGVDGSADISIAVTVDKSKSIVVQEDQPEYACMWYKVTSTESSEP